MSEGAKANVESYKPNNGGPSHDVANPEPSKPAEGTDSPSSKRTGEPAQPTKGTDSPSSKLTDGANSSENVSPQRTVKVTNVSVKTEKTEIEQFFAFSGDIHHVEMKKDNDTTQLAFVTYKDPQGAETALCLSGATLYDNIVTITLAEDYKLPPDAAPLDLDKTPPAVQKAEDVVSTMLARGFILGKDAVKKAKDFDEQHKLSNKASGIGEKVSTGAAAANVKAREMDQKYQVSEKTKKAGTAIMSNKYVMAGAAWVSNAYTVVAKRAEEVSAKTKEKVEKAERERQEKLAAMSPKSREKAEKDERERQERLAAMSPKSREKAEKAAEDAKAKEEAEKDSPKKADESKSPKNKEGGDKEKEKNVPVESPAAPNPSKSGDGKAENK